MESTPTLWGFSTCGKISVLIMVITSSEDLNLNQFLLLIGFQLFQKCLIKVLNIDLWKCYLSYVKETKSSLPNFR